MATSVFINLPATDLPKSMAFFRSLGFDFNPQFTNDAAACMVVSDVIYELDGHVWELMHISGNPS